MTIALGSTWLIEASNDGASTVINDVKFVPTMVDSVALTGLNGGSSTNYDYIVEQIITHQGEITSQFDNTGTKRVVHHSWSLRFVYANGAVPASSTTLANIATWVGTAITAYKAAGELTT